MQTWRVLAASTTGSSHRQAGILCQDAQAEATLAGGITLLAVADGAGSALRAREGSAAAVQAAITYLTTQLTRTAPAPQTDAAWRDRLTQTLTHARKALRTLARSKPLRDLATTLLLAVITPDHVALLQLGDGGIVARNLAGELLVLSSPGHSEYINETDFLTSENYLEAAVLTILPAASIAALALFTDGVEVLAMHHATNTPHPAFFHPLFDYVIAPEATHHQAVGELEAILASDRANDLTGDDKTLVLAVRESVASLPVAFDPPPPEALLPSTSSEPPATPPSASPAAAPEPASTAPASEHLPAPPEPDLQLPTQPSAPSRTPVRKKKSTRTRKRRP